MSVSPFGKRKPNCVKEVASLAMAHPTLRSINCPLVFAISHADTNEDRDPRYLVLSCSGLACTFVTAYTPRPVLPS